MEKRILGGHKDAPKHLEEMPVFRAAKKGRLQAPYDRFKSKRLQMTDLIPVAEAYRVIFLWRTGDLLTDTAFYAHLLLSKPDDQLHPLLEFHWHPSHKGFHCVTPCGSSVDYSGRLLSGAARELALHTDPHADPACGRARE